MSRKESDADQKQYSVNKYIRNILIILEQMENLHKNGKIYLSLPSESFSAGEILETPEIIQDKPSYDLQEIRTLESFKYCIPSNSFVAPELSKTDLKDVGVQADFYSLIAVFYYGITRKQITFLQKYCSEFPSKQEILRGDAISDEAYHLIIHILMKGLAPNPKRRYHSEDEIRKDFENLKQKIE